MEGESGDGVLLKLLKTQEKAKQNEPSLLGKVRSVAWVFAGLKMYLKYFKLILKCEWILNIKPLEVVII